MLKKNSCRSGFIVICLATLLAGCASTETREETQESVKAAEKTLINFQRDPEMRWLQENMSKARGILISPRILKGGFIYGGSGGQGLVLARGDAKTPWAGPAFYRLATASIGFQAGVESSEMVALIMTEKALNSLLSTSFKLGGDVSVAAGPIGMGAGAPVNADIVTFTRSKGLYGGLNLDGTVITIDEGGNKSFYGRPVTPVDILIKRNVSSPDAASLMKAASMGARK